LQEDQVLMSKEKSSGRVSNGVRHVFGHSKLLCCVVLGCLGHMESEQL